MLDCERRLRACKKLGHIDIEVIIKDYHEQQQKAVPIITDLMKDLLPIGDKAVGIAHLVNKAKKYTAESIAKALGMSVKRVKRFIKIGSLHPKVIGDINRGQIDEKQAECLTLIHNEVVQIKVANELSRGRDMEYALSQCACLVDFEDLTLYERIRKDRKLGVIMINEYDEKYAYCYDKKIYDDSKKAFEEKQKKSYAKTEEKAQGQAQDKRIKDKEDKAKRKGTTKKLKAKRDDIYVLLKTSTEQYFKTKSTQKQIDKIGAEFSDKISTACAKALLKAYGIGFVASKMNSAQIKELCYVEVLSKYIKTEKDILRLILLEHTIGGLEVNLFHLEVAKKYIIGLQK